MNKHKVWYQQSKLIFALPIMLAAFYMISTDPRYARAQPNHSEPLQLLQVLIKDQPDTPLRVLSVSRDSANAYTPELNAVVKNISLKGIRAYAIRYDIAIGESKSSGLETTIGADSWAGLQPNKSEAIDISSGVTYLNPIDSITVSIDFVEFTDGTTWGPDTRKTGERLDGMRAGGRAAISLLTKLMKTSSLQTVIDAVEAESIDIPPPTNRSPEWLDGFRHGIGLIQGRLKNTYADKGISEIEHTLQQPFDVPGWRWLR